MPSNKLLLDSSTYFDIVNAPKHRDSAWSVNTSANALGYLKAHGRFTISAFTIVEAVDGFKRAGQVAEISEFLEATLHKFEVIYPDQNTFSTAGMINGALVVAGNKIGIFDCLIAATAIGHGLDLVTANLKHFQRIHRLGYKFDIANWRDS